MGAKKIDHMHRCMNSKVLVRGVANFIFSVLSYVFLHPGPTLTEKGVFCLVPHSQEAQEKSA